MNIVSFIWNVGVIRCIPLCICTSICIGLCPIEGNGCRVLRWINKRTADNLWDIFILKSFAHILCFSSLHGNCTIASNYMIHIVLLIQLHDLNTTGGGTIFHWLVGIEVVPSDILGSSCRCSQLTQNHGTHLRGLIYDFPCACSGS